MVNSKIFILSLVNIFLLLIGQSLWKFGIQKVGSVSLNTAYQLVGSPYILMGFVFYALATLLWFHLLAIAPFSVIYPMQSMAYIFGIIIAWTIFGEAIPYTRWIGCAVIMAGVYIISLK